MTEPTPLDGVDVLLADLDGVVYAGQTAIAHAVESITAAANGRRIGYITNNASRTAASVAEHLCELGLEVVAHDVVTSPHAAVKLLADLVEPRSTILVIGGVGLTSVVAAAGFIVTDSAQDAPAAVIQGFSPDLGWAHLAEAAFALARDAAGNGIPWVATNTDWTIPVARGIAPGNGTLVSAVHQAVGILPIVAGKPEVAIFDEAVRRFGSVSPLFLGDRLDTDILGANRAGMNSVLVFTGIDGPKQLLAADKNSRPTFIVGDLRELHEPYPATIIDTVTPGQTRFSVGEAIVLLTGNVVSLAVAGPKQIDVIRAAAAAIWNSGSAIYALDVAPELYSWR